MKRMKFERKWSRKEQAVTDGFDAYWNECSRHCKCDPIFGVCDGVQAGGPCDDRQRGNLDYCEHEPEPDLNDAYAYEGDNWQ